MTVEELAQKLQTLSAGKAQIDVVKEPEAEYITVSGHGDIITIGFNESLDKYAEKLGLKG